MTKHRNFGKASWTIRRRIIFYSLLFCAFTVTYILLSEKDLEVYETIVTSAFALATLVISSYIGFATHEDIKNRESEIKDEQSE